MASLVRDVTLALAAASLIAITVLLLRRVVLARLERMRLTREGRLRGLALAIISGEAGDGADANLSKRDAEVLAAVLARYARQLTGEDRERITAVFERRGDVDRELEALHARRSSQRLRAALLLGDMRSERAIGSLVEALKADHDRDVRAAAARSLGRLAAEQAVPDLVEALAHVGVPRATAAQALLAIGPTAVPSLRPLASSPDPEIRAASVELIGLLGDAGDGEQLVPVLRDEAPGVRARAAAALGRLGAAEATAALRAGLEDLVPAVRAAVARALAAIGDVESVPDLLTQAREDDFEPAHAAAIAVARLQPTALPAPADELAGDHLVEAVDLVRFGVLSLGAGR